MTASQKTKKVFIKHRHWIASVGLLAAAVLGAILLLTVNPDSYKPVRPENPREVSPYLTHKLGPDFYDKVQMDQPFELLVEQEGINDILSRYPWPIQLEGFTIYTPMLTFSPETTVLMAKVDYRGLSSILSIYAKPYLDSDGKMNLNIQSVYLGLLPITPLARRVAEKYVREHFDPQDPIESVNYAMISNQPFDPVLRIFDKSARITKLTIESGRARLFLTPAN
ncbi:MAG TPA: hypothetical protein PKY88_09825 [Anaerohalosphaeraceae bacterium]|nr:hypothetical protein [Anaerohalosphaeraceae bacterium]